MLQVTSLPFSLAGPGQTASGGVELISPGAASYKAAITDQHSIFKVVKVTILRPNPVYPPDDPGVGDGVKVHIHRPVGEVPIVYVPAGSSDGITPLEVKADDKLQVTVQMACPNDPNDTYSATLTITSSNTDYITTVPLSVATGQIDVQVLNSYVTAAPGSVATWSLSVKSLAGAGANISFVPDLDRTGAPPASVSITPITMFLPRRGLKTLVLNAIVGEVTPPGSYRLYVYERTFNDQFLLVLTVTNPQVRVASSQPSNFSMVQGTQIEFAIDVTLQGAGPVPFDLTIGPTPPALVCSFLPVQANPITKTHLDLGTEQSFHLPVRLTLAQGVSSLPPLVFSWNAYGGSEQGTLIFGITPVPPSITLQQNVVTAGLSGLGGYVNLILNSNGTYTAHFHMWNSSKVTGYDYAVRAIFSAPNGVAFVVQHSGHVGAASLFGGSSMDDYTEPGMHPWVQGNWASNVHGQMAVTHEYSASGGVLGELESLAKDIVGIAGLGFFGGTAGNALGMTIALTKEATRVFSGIGQTIAVIGGVVVFPVAIAGAAPGTALMFATVAGVALGAVSELMVQKRPIFQAEYDFANSSGVGGSNFSTDPDNASVFMGALPRMDNLWITNLCSPDRERAFTAPGTDGRTYLNMGGAYNFLLEGGGTPGTGRAYPAKGQLLIHELTHALQIELRNIPGVVCSGIYNGVASTFGDDVYKFGPAGPDWHSSYFNLESQAAVVDHWFAGEDKDNHLPSANPPMDRNSPYFRYIDQVRRRDI